MGSNDLSANNAAIKKVLNSQVFKRKIPEKETKCLKWLDQYYTLFVKTSKALRQRQRTPDAENPGTGKSGNWLWYLYIPGYKTMLESEESNVEANLNKMIKERTITLTELIQRSRRISMGEGTAKALIHALNMHIIKQQDNAEKYWL